MEALADEARAYRVRINVLCSTGVKTDIGKMLQEADGTSVNDTYFLETEEVADVAFHGQSMFTAESITVS